MDQPLTFSPTHSSLHTLSSVENDKDIVYHTIHQVAPPTGSDRASIQAWAANIPYGASDGSSSPQSSRASSRCSSPQPMRTPQLLLNHRRPVAPTLCMSTPQPTCPKQSRPILTPQQTIASMNITSKSYPEAATPGASVTSLLSGLTDSFVATPSSTGVADPLSHQEPSISKSAAMFEVLATQVRSWVHPSQSHLHPRASHPAVHTVCQQKSFSHCTTADDMDCDAVWWAPEASVVRRNGTPDHPAYHVRGRKASRPFP